MLSQSLVAFTFDAKIFLNYNQLSLQD